MSLPSNVAGRLAGLPEDSKRQNCRSALSFSFRENTYGDSATVSLTTAFYRRGGGQCSLKSSKSDFLFSHFTQYKCILFCHSSFFFFAPKFASQGCFFVKSLHFISFCNFPPSHPEPVWYIFLFLSPLDYLWWP